MFKHIRFDENMFIFEEYYLLGYNADSPLKINWRFEGTYRLDPEDGGDIFLRNVGWLLTDYTALFPRRWYSS
jgi:hypothetical protein